ncbi:hypothetical protein, partial [Enterobacter cloacae complex sp. 2DZ2F20B]|uniref:hypothetical protein n=1 Tax=Enterobacter cloacae complex sp. 2DZ2F20B TaxID=2511993 RepID=UPI001CA53165
QINEVQPLTAMNSHPVRAVPSLALPIPTEIRSQVISNKQCLSRYHFLTKLVKDKYQSVTNLELQFPIVM